MSDEDSLEETIQLSSLLIKKSYTDEQQASDEKVLNDGPERNGIAWYSATFLSVCYCVGIGLLELPWAYNAAGGLLPASIVHYTVSALMTGGMVILAYIAHLTQASSYQEAMLMTLGNLGHKLCIMGVVATGTMDCVVFLVAAGDYIERFVAHAISEEFVTTWYGNQKVLITILGFIIILPMCLLREIKALKHSSFLGFLVTVFITALIAIKYFVRSTEAVCFSTNATWTDSLLIAPSVSGSYLSHLSIIAVLAAMTERNTTGSAKTVAATMLICLVFSTSVAVFGYLTFGNSVNKDIFLSYSPTVDIYIAYFVLALKCFLAFPVVFLCVRSALQDLWLAAWKMTPDEAIHRERKRRIFIGVVGYIMILGIYIAVPDLMIAMTLSGGMGSFCSFILPGLSLFKSVIDKANVELRKTTEVFLIGLGVFYVTSGLLLFGLSTVQEIIE